MKIDKIKVEPGLSLGAIMKDVEGGKLRIPRFQREFVWERAKVMRLLDSIYHQFPVGSFFFWQAPKKYNKFFRNIAELKLPEPDERDQMTFILDGQQRITSLYTTIKGLSINDVDYSHICFDLEKQEFMARKGDNRRYIAVCEMLNEEKHLEIHKNLIKDESLPHEYSDRFATCREIFMTYPFSVVIVRDTELEDVCDIFERINQSGKRLSLTDLVIANTWSKDFDLRKKIEKLNITLANKGFQRIEGEAITESLSLNIKGGCTRSFQLQMTTDEIKEAWKKTTESVNLAIDFLRGNLAVKRYSFLPYRGIIPILTYYFYKSNNRALIPFHKEIIEKWFWRVSFSERYSAAAATRIGEDRKLFDQIINDQQASVEYPVNIKTDTIKNIQMPRKSAIKNAVMCLLALKGPRHFRNNTLMPLDDNYFSDFNSPEKHHIFPASFLKEQKIVAGFSLANFCFIPAELNKEISNKKPTDYFKGLKDKNPEFEKTMVSHLIPIHEESGIWGDDYSLFIQQRAELIVKEIESLLGEE